MTDLLRCTGFPINLPKIFLPVDVLLLCSLYFGDVNSKLLDKIWVPSVFLHNLKEEEAKGTLTVPTFLNMAFKVLTLSIILL